MQASEISLLLSNTRFGELSLTNLQFTKWKGAADLIDLLRMDFRAEEFGFSDIWSTTAHEEIYDYDYPKYGVTIEKLGIELEVAKLAHNALKSTLETIIALFDEGNVYQFVDDTVRIIKRTSAKPEWVQNIEALGTKSPSAEQLVGIIRDIKSVISTNDYWQIDTAFRSIELSRVSVEGLIALLRTSYSHRSFLETWAAFLDSVRRELIKRGLAPEDVLFGLI